MSDATEKQAHTTDFIGRFEWNHAGTQVRGLYVSGASTKWYSTEAEARLAACAAVRCREEWEGVNDPPCHPSDSDWRPCVVCAPAAKTTGGAS